MTDILSWVATVATISGALLTASNLGARITGTGFIVFLFGSLTWLAVGAMTGQSALTWTNLVLTFLNIFGIWRWLGRQATVEDGAKAAAQASDEMPGESLFPVSILSRAKAFAGDEELGVCVDAMAGERTGTLAYVVISEGGVAGIGERFRRVPWDMARVSGNHLVADLDRARFCRLPEVPKDEWPGR